MTEKPAIAIFDLDHTISKRDTYLAFLFEVLKAHPSKLIRAAWLPFAVLMHKTGLRSNSWLKEAFLSTIAGGLDTTQIAACSNRFLLSLQKNGLHQDALKAVKGHKTKGHYLILATASFDIYVDDLTKILGFDRAVCSLAAWNNHQLEGRIRGKNCYGQEKKARITDLLNDLDITKPCQIYVYSDHHSDLPLLTMADIAIAVNPTRKLRKQALKLGIDTVSWH